MPGTRNEKAPHGLCGAFFAGKMLLLEFRTQGEIPGRAGEAGAVIGPRNVNTQGESKEEKPPAKAGSNQEVFLLHPVRR